MWVLSRGVSLDGRPGSGLERRHHWDWRFLAAGCFGAPDRRGFARGLVDVKGLFEFA